MTAPFGRGSVALGWAAHLRLAAGCLVECSECRSRVVDGFAAGSSSGLATGATGLLGWLYFHQMIFLQTQAYETHGGMQTYMRRIAEIMSEICEETEMPFDSVSVTDSVLNLALHTNECHYNDFLAARGNRARFVSMAVDLCRKAKRAGVKHKVAVLGHVSLAPVGDWLRRLGLIDHYVVVLHGIEAWVPKSRINRAACRRASGIVATTRYTAKEFQIQNQFAHRAMHVVPLALPEHHLLPRKVTAAGGRLSVLTVGRLDSSERYKGFEHLIHAVGRLVRDGAEIELKIVGVGDDRQRLEAQARDAAPDGRVRFLGGVPEEMMERVYQEADVFAMPSKNEGFGLVFLEAMRYGKPCIGGNHGGTPEVVRHGVDGYLVEFGDEDSLTRHLGEMAGDRSLVKELGRNAYEHASAEYVYPVMREGWWKILREFAVPEYAEAV